METTTVNTVVKNNELIAEFMGWSVIRNLKYSTPYTNCKGIGFYELYFHKSWDWLMPVVDKCTQTGDDTSQWDDLADALTTINIENTYQAVVEFIQWYNKIK